MTGTPRFVLVSPWDFDQVAPLGLRFVDELRDCPVVDGLRVSVHPEGEPSCRRFGRPNGSGTWVVHGLRDAGASGDPARFVVDVEDGTGRFLPARCVVEGLGARAWKAEGPSGSAAAAAAARGSGEARTQGEPWTPIPLFSAPSRAVPGTTAVVRAELCSDANGAPAAWAVLDVVMGNSRARGVADERGRVGVYFPYPSPQLSVDGGMPRLTDLQWTVALEAFHSARREASGGQPPGSLAPLLPLDWALQQTRARISAFPKKLRDREPARGERAAGRGVARGGATLGPDATATLRFGRELILQGPEDAPDRRLLLSPVAQRTSRSGP